ncbi:DUF4185 domain-containing protein [Rhodococcus sp. p52]|uniref:DUF4185 domain-containing protein n=1 Tax=Rhodococcus sp. p52 TaxID=935199 RepID=UPI003FA7D377
MTRSIRTCLTAVPALLALGLIAVSAPRGARPTLRLGNSPARVRAPDPSARDHRHGIIRTAARGTPANGAAAATPDVPPAVGEMSVQFLGGEFVMLYGNEANGTIEMRTSARPEGPWSEARVLVPHREIGGLYAPFIHPWSTDTDLYFTASRWGDYNVILLRTTLS